MVLYECQLCDFSSKLNSNYKRHINSKKHKKRGLLEGVEVEKKNEKDQKKTILGPFLPEKETILGPKKDHFCLQCNKVYKHKTHLYRHLKSSCKVLKVEQNELNNLKMIIGEQKKIHEENKKEKNKLYDYIDQLLEKTGDTNINIGNQTTNQINLNNFGEEDLSHISDNFKMQMLKLPYGGIQQMIERVHFSNIKPENRNIALTNKREKMIKVRNKKKWRYQDKDYTVDDLIKRNYNRLDEYYLEVAKNLMIDRHVRRYEIFQKKFDTQDEALMKRLKKETEMILLSDNL